MGFWGGWDLRVEGFGRLSLRLKDLLGPVTRVKKKKKKKGRPWSIARCVRIERFGGSARAATISARTFLRVSEPRESSACVSATACAARSLRLTSAAVGADASVLRFAFRV